jgi:hypothetical protein
MLVVVVYGCLDSPPTTNNLPLAKWDTLPLAFGDIAFLFCVHFLILPIHNSMSKAEDFNDMIDKSFCFCGLSRYWWWYWWWYWW